MQSDLRITRLRLLPVGTFRNHRLQKAEDAIGRPTQSGFPSREFLLFDLPSLLEAHKSGIIPHLVGGYCLNTILIPELLLHQLDTMNKKASHTISIDSSVDEVTQANRVRDLLAFLFKSRKEECFVFQRKGVNENVGFLNKLGLKKDLNDERRFVSWALYMQERDGAPVTFVTSNALLRKCAEEYNVRTACIKDFREE